MNTVLYKNYEIEVTGYCGDGSYERPLTNTPYGYIIYENSINIWSRDRVASTHEYAVKSAKSIIDYNFFGEREK